MGPLLGFPNGGRHVFHSEAAYSCLRAGKRSVLSEAANSRGQLHSWHGLGFQPLHFQLYAVNFVVLLEGSMQLSFRELTTIGGVFHDLLPVSGWCAEQRESKVSEPIDLVKAIYLVDLEHVSKYWSDWEGFEAFIMEIPLAGGRKVSYINRARELFELFMSGREEPGRQFVTSALPSAQVQEILRAAQELASARGCALPPSSRDLLLCACRQDQGLSEALQKSGLRLDRLTADLS